MEYNFNNIEKKWQERWRAEGTYRVTEDSSKEKFYVLDMFPYPSGAGLHVGHPLGISLLMCMHVICVIKDIMFCTQWVTIRLGYQQSNTLYKQVNILLLLQIKYSALSTTVG